jgi:protein involved in sex pheromone biosynthesis
MNKLIQLTILAAVLGLIGCQSLKDRMSGHHEQQEKTETMNKKDMKPSMDKKNMKSGISATSSKY